MIEKERLIFSFTGDSPGIQFLSRTQTMEEIKGSLERLLDDQFEFLQKDKNLRSRAETMVEGLEIKVNMQTFFSELPFQKNEES